MKYIIIWFVGLLILFISPVYADKYSVETKSGKTEIVICESIQYKGTFTLFKDKHGETVFIIPNNNVSFIRLIK